MEGPKISEDKLQRRDYFRVQAQFKSRDDKIVWSAEYGFIAEQYPEIAQRIRDYAASRVIKKLKEDFRTILKSNPTVKPRFSEWLKQNVSDSQLLKEINQIVYDD